MAFNNWPYTNFQDLNLNWILDKVKNAISSGAEALTKATEALSKASYAKDTSDDAKDMAQSAQYTAGQANLNAQSAEATAGLASQKAELAKTAAENAETSATAANTNAANAVNTANNALQVAEGAVGAYRITISGNNTCSHAGNSINANDIVAAITSGKTVDAMKINNANGVITFYEVDSYFIDESLPAGERTTVYFKRIEDEDSHEMFYERGAITGTSNTMHFAEMARVHEVTVDETLTVSGAAADAKATGDGFSDLQSALNMIETPQIVGMLPTGKTVESSNLFSKASLVASGKYVDRIDDGKAVLADNANYDTYLIPVDGDSIYTFTNCRTAVVVSDLEYTAVSALLSNVSSINSTGGTLILFSFNPTTYPTASYKVTKPVAEYIIPNNWNLDKGTKTGYQRKTGSIASGGVLALTGKTAIKYGYQIIFKAFISAFNEIKLAFYNYNNSAISNAITITSSNLIIYVGTTAVETLPHGLTIANDISLVLDYRSDGVKVTLYSNGESFTTTTTFERLTSGVVSPSIVSTGTVCTSAVLEMTVLQSKKPVWYFGDSYISFSNPARWAYYLVESGFDTNTLLNGYAGGTSATTVFALTALLNYGTPKYAVFATGMNDGSDSNGVPSTSWVNARNSFLTLCDSNGIIPIFATVPTVPSINNEAKNAWVKSSGYRYIDFAKAVGADGTGAWYSGMLSTDNVHPTEKGAKALYTQAITDFSEFLT